MTSRGERIVLGFLSVLAVLIMLVLYAPAALVVFLSFFDVQGRKIDWGSFGLQWYARLAERSDIIHALLNSLLVAASAVLASLIVALGIAYCLKVLRKPDRAYVEFVIFLPFILPAIITGISLLITFHELGIDRTLATIVIGHLVVCLPVVYRMLMVRVEAIPDSHYEASLDLGAGHVRTFFCVILPQLKLAIIAGAMLAFMISFDETLITFLLVGNEMTLPIRLWAMMRVGFTPEVNALVSLALLLTLALTLGGTVLMRNWNRDEGGR